MKLKKTISIFVAAMCLSAVNANAKTPLDLSVNDAIIDVSDEIYIKDGYTMVPIRKLSRILGSHDIKWNNDTKTATINFGNDILSVQTGSQTAYLNGIKEVMPVRAEVRNDKTYLPARFLCDSMGAEIMWNEKTHTVAIKKDGISINPDDVNKLYTKNDFEWLAKIVHAEAQGEGHSGKVAVANVVLNRRESKEFPDTVYDVVFDRKYGVQFTPIMNGAIHNNPSKDSYKAAKQALFGNNVAGNSLYFLNPKKATSLWIVNNRTFYQSIGNHDFYL